MIDAVADQQRGDSPLRLVAVGGLSGSGKSTVARLIGGIIGRAPGARILRSDVLRKRIAGVSPETRLSAQHYEPGFGRRVYAQLEKHAARALGEWVSVIADATFTSEDDRTAIEIAAQRKSARFDGFWLECPPGVRTARIAERGPDASDAGAVVAVSQKAPDSSRLGDWQPLDATAPPAHVARAVAERLRNP
ncbi:AAA family ATPase [Sphingomonas qilianensis]|uniref:AAA family ATPase n=1 Tax=Sphingomonas qilianensis TaxID=1736690 RepID=A0ABU9XQJ8_9SPHN